MDFNFNSQSHILSCRSTSISIAILLCVTEILNLATLYWMRTLSLRLDDPHTATISPVNIHCLFVVQELKIMQNLYDVIYG